MNKFKISLLSKVVCLAAALVLSISLTGQSISLQGYVYEADNRGYINQATIDILTSPNKSFVTSTMTDADGFFKADVPMGQNFLLRVRKDLYVDEEAVIEAKGVAAGAKKFINVEMERKPGYIFDVTMADPRNNDTITTSGIHQATVEVYNNTNGKEVMRLIDYNVPNFKVTFEQGNHYTILLRKEGYYAKRMEAYVNIKGCILCFDGVGTVQPGVSDVLTAGHQMGTLLANVEMKPIVLDEKTKLQNINYASGSAALNSEAKEELKKVADILKDNPGMKVELSSHTDSRGGDELNMKLSQKRAKVAKDFVIMFAQIDAIRVLARGYGETRLDNGCADGVECNERQHRRNRRTEIKILEFNQPPKSQWKPLAEMKRLEKMELMLADLQNQEVVQIPADAGAEDLPDDLKKQLGLGAKEKLEEAKDETPKPKFDSPKPKKPSGITTRTDVKEEVIEMVDKRTDPSAEEAKKQAIEKKLGNVSSVTTMIQQGAEKVTASASADEEAMYAEMIEAPKKNLQLVPGNYTGYKIAVAHSAELLDADNQLFMVFGNLQLYQDSNGYHYLLGDFKEAKDAELFLNNIIKSRYPSAEIMGFDQGKAQ